MCHRKLFLWPEVEDIHLWYIQNPKDLHNGDSNHKKGRDTDKKKILLILGPAYLRCKFPFTSMILPSPTLSETY